MQRCVSCSGTLRNDETSCFICGTPVPPAVKKTTLADRFRTFTKVAFLLSSALTVASLFFSFTPSFTKCVVATLVLSLVNRSAEQMRQSQ